MYQIFDLPAFMASSENKAKTESDVTLAGEETSDFDDDTSKGDDSYYSINRSRFLPKNCSALR